MVINTAISATLFLINKKVKGELSMQPLFSQRHKSWIYDVPKCKKNNLSFGDKLRESLVSILEKHSRHECYERGINYSDEYTCKALSHMKLILGENSFDRKSVSSGEMHRGLELAGLIRIGYPSDVLDCIEAFLYCIEGEDKTLFIEVQEAANKILKIHNSHWRFVDAIAMLIDSFYIAEEVIAIQYEHLNKLGASGVIAEFREAHNAFQMGNYKSSLQESQKSLESAITTVINDNRQIKGSGALVDKLKTSKVLPGQYINFADNFIKLIGAVNAGRSQPGGAHGQGSEIIEIDPCEAEFILNLTAVFNKYLAGLYLKQQELD